MALHFVGFSDEAYYRAIRVFGPPDFIHRIWDGRAKSMILEADPEAKIDDTEGDVAVFAVGTADDMPSLYAWDDSQHR